MASNRKGTDEHAEECVVVGVGASAGGFEAFRRLLAGMPEPTDLAIVFVQHLEPTQPSHAAELLAAKTRMAVTQAEDGMRVEPGRLYTNPPGKYLTIAGGALHVEEMGERRGARFPIDVFLRSLAADKRNRAVGVILSGTGTDGTAGVRAIKEAGGMVIVQEPEDAEQAGMPSSAIAAGAVDDALPVASIASALVAYAQHPYARLSEAEAPPSQRADIDIAPVLSLLKAGGRIDFRNYKPSTIARRIQRRMGLSHVTSIEEYLARLRRDPEEAERLRKDLLISVTEFFRDPPAWTAIEEDVIPQILSQPREGPIRVWVPACATGEEAYSLVMLLAEARAQGKTDREIVAFATDVNEDALAIARAATFPESSLASLPTARLNRFFVQERGRDHYRAVKEIRDPIAFSAHDLLADPPFSKLDIIACRNLMIYLEPEAQETLLSIFHFALRPGGYLFLGSAETAGADEGLFEPVSKKWRIYRRVGESRHDHSRFPLPAFSRGHEAERPRTQERAGRGSGFGEVAQRWLLAEYAPPAVIVNQRHEIVYIHGDVGKYLNLPRGEPVLDLLGMLQAGYRSRVRSAIREAFRESRAVRIPNVRAGRSDMTHSVSLHVQPVRTRASAEPVVIVTFEEEAADPLRASPDGPRAADGQEAPQGLIQQLEDELTAVKEDLRGTIDALEASNEELKASNEEIMSMNEEFRSTNEELETSKEELQSINEELTTLNAQLREKVEMLHALSDDLNNVLTSADIPIVILDPELRIRRFTPGMTRLLNVIPTDVGRSLTDITRRFEDPTLLDDAKRVLATLAPKASEVRTEDGTRYVRRIQPYRTNDDHIAGTVIAFVDVEAVKRAAEAVQAAQRYAEQIVETVREPLLILDESLSVVSANAAFYRDFETEPERTRGRRIDEVRPGEWDTTRLVQLLREVLSDEISVEDLEMEYKAAGAGPRTLLVNAREVAKPARDETLSPPVERKILLAIRDITARKEAERRLKDIAAHQEDRVRERTAQLEEANRVLRVANESLDAFTYVVGHDLKEPARAVESLLSVIDEDHGPSLGPEVRSLLAKARAANTRLSSLVTGLLAFSRASRAEAATPQAITLDEVLRSQDCVTRYRQRLEERGARLEYPDPKVAVQAHPAAVSQILGNLVENAIKHNPAPEPWVRVRAHALPGGKLVEVVVEDNGPGFPSDVVAGLARMTTTTRGFGLTIAKRSTELQGGLLWLEQRAAGGGVVHFTLPAPPNGQRAEGASADPKKRETP